MSSGVMVMGRCGVRSMPWLFRRVMSRLISSTLLNLGMNIRMRLWGRRRRRRVSRVSGLRLRRSPTSHLLPCMVICLR